MRRTPAGLVALTVSAGLATDLTGAGEPRSLTVWPAAATIHSITVVDIP